MIKRYADMWLEALRSDKFKQGKYRLKGGDKYCCLGVLEEILRSETGNGPPIGGYLQHSTVEIVGMRNRRGGFQVKAKIKGETVNSLSAANDEGATFQSIANFIEKHWKWL